MISALSPLSAGAGLARRSTRTGCLGLPLERACACTLAASIKRVDFVGWSVSGWHELTKATCVLCCELSLMTSPLAEVRFCKGTGSESTATLWDASATSLELRGVPGSHDLVRPMLGRGGACICRAISSSSICSTRASRARCHFRFLSYNPLNTLSTESRERWRELRSLTAASALADRRKEQISRSLASRFSCRCRSQSSLSRCFQERWRSKRRRARSGVTALVVCVGKLGLKVHSLTSFRKTSSRNCFSRSRLRSRHSSPRAKRDCEPNAPELELRAEVG